VIQQAINGAAVIPDWGRDIRRNYIIILIYINRVVVIYFGEILEEGEGLNVTKAAMRFHDKLNGRRIYVSFSQEVDCMERPSQPIISVKSRTDYTMHP
jgi:hypothetical protein